MILETIRKYPIFKKLYLDELGKRWVSEKKNRLLPYLSTKDTLLDVGCGNCLLANELKEDGYSITGVDVANLSIIDDFQPKVYDGQHLPFENNAFDCALLLTVLHHTDDPVEVLRETSRVAHRILIIEDVYSNIFQQYLTYAMDTLVNFGHSNMTYQNKSIAEWKSVFDLLQLKLLDIKEKRVLLFFKQVTFVLE